MRITLLLILCAIPTSVTDAGAQRRGGGGAVTLAVAASDPSGAPLTDVLVTVKGPAERTARTEGGRIAFEGLPAGTYRVRFDREDLIPFEKELTARGAAPIDVKVTLNPAPRPKPVPCEPPPPPPALSVDAVAVDVPAFLEKNFIGRDPSKSSSLSCATAGAATLIQVRQPLDEHAHADADEFVYVVAGTGSVSFGSREHPLQSGTYLMVPRAMRHTFTAKGRNPLVLLSVRAGERCAEAR